MLQADEWQPNVQTLIVGFDELGGHIYRIVGGIVEPFDGFGWAAVGSGAEAAIAHFTFSQFSARERMERALCVTLAAKRKAQIASGVGQTTDFFVIDATGIKQTKADFMERLDAIVNTALADERRSWQTAENAAADLVSRWQREG